LFGSRARGDHRAQSDTDVAVLLSGAPGPFLETKLALADIAYDVLLETGVLIQPLPIWQSEWDCPESSTHPRLLENVKRDGVPL
jgi:antitoxin ChpS